MKNPLYQVPDEYPDDTGCSQCGAPDILHGFHTPLCNDCRQGFIRYPIPLLIKIFGGAILLIMVWCCFSFPSDLSLGLHIERGKRAEGEKKFLTAQREFTKAAAAMPNNTEIQCHLALAAFNNMDLTAFSVIAEKLVGKSIGNDLLYQKVDDAMAKFNSYVPKDSMIELMKVHRNNIPDQSFQQYLRNHPDDIYAHFSYASVLFDQNRFRPCDSILKNVLRIDAGYFPALRLMASLKREMNEYDSADKYCDDLLRINHEAGYAIASKARTRLKQKKDSEALELALQSVETDNLDPYNTATLILAWHFNGEEQKRDALIEECRVSDNETSREFVQYAKDVISGKVPFRTQ